ncbi:MAG: ImpA family metalloprotease [Craterilacuibacter sp.]
MSPRLLSMGGGEQPYDAISAALASGDASELPLDAHPLLLAQARTIALTAKSQHAQLLQPLIIDGISQGFDFGGNSRQVGPSGVGVAASLVIADNGASMAAVSEVDSGRAMSWGGNVLWNMALATRTQQDYYPFFKRSFTWLLTGNAAGAMPAKVRYSSHAYPAADVTAFLNRAGSSSTAVACAIERENSCWQDIDLFVFGQGSSNTEATAAQVRKYLAAGKSVAYFQQNWGGGATLVNEAMGLTLSPDYGGQFWGKGAVAATRTAAESLQKADEKLALSARIALVDALASDDLANWNTNGYVAAIDRITQEKNIYQSRGDNPFVLPGTDFLRHMLLWADVWRPEVDYGPLNKTGNAAAFLRALASDSWSYAARATTSTPKSYGDWMPAAVSTIAHPQTPEEMVVTIAQGSGKTAIGRGALPGKPVEIEVLDDGGAAYLGVRIGYIRARGNPLSDNYDRPRYPDGHQVVLKRGQVNTVVFPWGGPLFLDYSGTAAGKEVKLRIKGGIRYAHFDFTKPIDMAEQAEAVAALSRGDFGWQTAKFEGGEVQQTIAKAKSVVGSKTPERYVQDDLKGLIFDSNHLVNGYGNMPMSPKVAELCAQFAWECSGSKQRAPSVQHFVGWIAACGFLCSGNPSDGYAGLAPGWGWWHELGHNTVPRSQKLVFEGKGCVTECDNNILANASALRQYALTGADVNGDRIDHKTLYGAAKRSVDKGLSDAALQQDIYSWFWVGAGQSHNAMRAVHFQLAYLYAQVRHGQAKPEPLTSLEYFTLLSKGDRLVASAWDAANKGKYAMGRYANNSISNHELLYVLSSKVIGRDLRKLFELYGIPLSAQATDSVADLALPLQDKVFYALAPGKGNQLASGQWLNLESGMPVYPY